VHADIMTDIDNLMVVVRGEYVSCDADSFLGSQWVVMSHGKTGVQNS
jgi:hypothetical protein